MENWFVTPGEITKLPLSGGVEITIRRRLNTGQQRARYDRMYEAGVDGQMKVKALHVSMALVSAYLLDWTVCDARGPVAIAGLPIEDLVTILDNLEPERFEEIHWAIREHVARMDASRDAEKKTPSGEPASSAISALPPDAAGATNGSSNLIPMSTT